MKLFDRIVALFRRARPVITPESRRALSATSAEMTDLARQIEREIVRQDEGRKAREVRRG